MMINLNLPGEMVLASIMQTPCFLNFANFYSQPANLPKATVCYNSGIQQSESQILFFLYTYFSYCIKDKINTSDENVSKLWL